LVKTKAQRLGSEHRTPKFEYRTLSDLIKKTISVAPMMDWTDRHDRAFLRVMSRHARLYTEMITTGALLHGDSARFLRFDETEHPVAAQLGGSDPQALAQCARMVEAEGYDEVNLNVGCPSSRVQAGRFGACLMKEPDLVAECVDAMRAAVRIPVTVKSRIGVDDQDSVAALHYFVERIVDAGCETLIVHARKAWLSGLSPKENREVPPLRYDLVYDLKQAFPALEIVLNGGVETLDAATDAMTHVDGIMIGRAAYKNPWILAGVDPLLVGAAAPVDSRTEAVLAYLPYIEAQLAAGAPLIAMTRHILGLFNGLPGARAWRRLLSENARQSGAGVDVVRDALALVRDEPVAAAA
jgi:tRNA-dihydrouridine synthase A